MSDEQKVNRKAVLFGVLTDICSTFIAGVAIGVGASVVLVAQGASPEEIDEQMKEPNFLILSLVVGLICTALGGFVAGYAAGRYQVLHGCLVGASGAVIGLAFAAGHPLWFNVAAFASVIPCGALGGGLAAVVRRPAPRSAEPEDEPTKSDGER